MRMDVAHSQYLVTWLDAWIIVFGKRKRISLLARYKLLTNLFYRLTQEMRHFPRCALPGNYFDLMGRLIFKFNFTTRRFKISQIIIHDTKALPSLSVVA